MNPWSCLSEDERRSLLVNIGLDLAPLPDSAAARAALRQALRDGRGPLPALDGRTGEVCRDLFALLEAPAAPTDEQIGRVVEGARALVHDAGASRDDRSTPFLGVAAQRTGIVLVEGPDGIVPAEAVPGQAMGAPGPLALPAGRVSVMAVESLEPVEPDDFATVALPPGDYRVGTTHIVYRVPDGAATRRPEAVTIFLDDRDPQTLVWDTDRFEPAPLVAPRGGDRHWIVPGAAAFADDSTATVPSAEDYAEAAEAEEDATDEERTYWHDELWELQSAHLVDDVEPLLVRVLDLVGDFPWSRPGTGYVGQGEWLFSTEDELPGVGGGAVALAALDDDGEMIALHLVRGVAGTYGQPAAFPFDVARLEYPSRRGR